MDGDHQPTSKVEEKLRYVNKERDKGAVKVPVPPDFKDLSKEHKTLGCLCEEVKNLAEYEQLKLTSEQVGKYWEQGYLSNIPVLSEEQCDALLKDYMKVFHSEDGRLHPGHGLLYEFHKNQGGDPNNVLLHSLGHWRITPAFHDVCFLPQIAVPASQLIDESRKLTAIRFWHDQIFSKPAHHGGVVAWHQDYSYWTRTKPMKHITVHIALDDQTPETGGLHFVPGSHRWHRKGMPLPITDDTFGDMDSIKKVLTEEEQSKFHPIPSGLKKGQASFHHPLLVHGSYANRSDRPRRAAVVNYFADGVVSDTDTPLLHGVPIIKKGEKMCGQFFPVVHDPRWITVQN